jgi:hypothetical protein
MLTRVVEERQSQKGGALFYVTVEAEFDFVSAEDGSKHTVKTFGEAMDRGDKGTNKAMSAAYKYAAFQAFAIPTEGDNDADAHTHEVEAKPKRGGVAQDVLQESPAIAPERQEQLAELAKTAQDDFDAYGAQAAYERLDGLTDNLEKIFVSTKLTAPARNGIKAYSLSLNQPKRKEATNG